MTTNDTQVHRYLDALDIVLTTTTDIIDTDETEAADRFLDRLHGSDITGPEVLAIALGCLAEGIETLAALMDKTPQAVIDTMRLHAREAVGE
jgi:hypothetical protein